MRNVSMEELRKKLTDIENDKENIYENGYIVIADEYRNEFLEDCKIYILKKEEYFIYNYMRNEKNPLTAEILAYDVEIEKNRVEECLKNLKKNKLITEYNDRGINFYILSIIENHYRYKTLLSDIDKGTVEKEYILKLLRAKQNKIISLEEMKKLKEDINELESKTYGNILVFLGIFISIFSLISININFLDILKDLNMYEKISLISVVNLVTVISISALIGLIEIVKRPKIKDSKYPIGVVIGIIIILLVIFVTATLLNPKENKPVAEKTESQKNIYTIEVTGKIDKETINILEKLNGTNNIKIVPKEK